MSFDSYLENRGRAEGLKIQKEKLKQKKMKKKKGVAGKSDTYSKKRKPNFGNALAKAAIKKFTGLDIEDWGHN